MELGYTLDSAFTVGHFAYILSERLMDLTVGITFLILSLASLLFLKALFLGRSLRFRRITLPSFFLMLYIPIMAVPSVAWFSVSLDESRYTALAAVLVVPSLIVMGVVAANTVLRIPAQVIERFGSSRLSPRREDKILGPLYVLLLLLGVLFIAVYVAVAPTVSLLTSVLSYGELSATDVRFAIYEVPESIQYLYALAVRFLLPASVLIAYFMAYVHRSAAWWSVFWITLPIGFFGATLSLERSGVFGLFLVLVLATYFRIEKVRWRLIVILIMAGIVGGVIHRAQYQLQIEFTDLFSYMLNFVGNRVLMDPSYMTFLSFQLFNEDVGFLLGRSIRLLSVFYGSYEPFSSVGFVGDLWVNFGWAGVTLGAIILGWILQSIQVICFRRKSVIAIVVFVLLLLNSVWLMYGSILSLMVVSVYLLSGVLGLATRCGICLGESRLRDGPRMLAHRR